MNTQIWDGFADGTAKGMAPKAHLVMYKNTWNPLSPELPHIRGSEMDMLASYEAAIADDVEMNMFEGYQQAEFFEDAVAIGSFHAMKNGILTIASAGNDGPDPETM